MYKVLILSLLLLVSPASVALGKLGHQVVCQLAYQHLSINKQNKINALLVILSAEDKQLINRYNYRNSQNKITYADTCTWADAIKKDNKYDQYKPWHYLNIARNQTSVTQGSCTKNCVSHAILHHSRQLATAKTPQQRAHALMFLGHWLGDIHQPLHVSYADDLGGNQRRISTTQGKCNNLHWLWDACLITANLDTKINTIQSPYMRLLSKLSAQWHSAPISIWQQENVYQWASESLALIRAPAFTYCKITQQDHCHPLTAKVIHLPRSYLVKYQPILEQRILQAAVRLNGLLSAAL